MRWHLLACEYTCTYVCVSLFISSPSARKTLCTGLEYGIITLPFKAWTTEDSLRPLEGHSLLPLGEATLRAVILATFHFAFTIPWPEITH
jgi:hypothetical protein